MDLNTRLSTIYFFDALSFALVMSVIPPYIIVVLGGSHKVLGVFAAGGALIQLLSGPFLRTLNERYSKLKVLLWCSRAALILNFCLVFEQSYWVLIFNRFIYAFLNHTQLISRNLLTENKQDNLDKLLPILNTAAFIIGPITSGYLSETVTYVFILSSILQLTNMLNVTSIEESEKKPDKPSSSPAYTEEVIRKVRHDLSETVNACKKCDLQENRDVLLLKLLMTVNMSVYFMKFPVMLIYNYRASPLVIGSTVAHQSIMFFISNLALEYAQNNMFKNNTVLTVGVFLIGVLGCCFSPTHELHLLFIIPMVLGKTCVDDAFNKISSTRKDGLLKNATNGFCNLARIVVPISCGVLCDIFGPRAIKFLSIWPVIVIFYLLYTHEKPYTVDESKSKKDISKTESESKVDEKKSKKID